MAWTIPISSRSYTARERWRGTTGQLKKATECFSWISTTSNPWEDASHSTTKGWPKSGRTSTDAVVIVVSNASKALVTASIHTKPSCIGAAMVS
jgi:hypothetical protein